MLVNPVINKLVDFCHGKEGQQDAVGAVARFLQSHGAHAPAEGQPSRWPDIDALKTSARHYGPPLTMAQIDEAVALANDSPLKP